MTFYERGYYKNFAAVVERHIRANSSLILLSVPGLGASYLIKKFLEEKSDEEIKHITMPGESLGKFNFLDLDFDRNEKAFDISEEYFKKALADQKFALLINAPYWLESEEFKKSYLSRHVYERFYFQSYSGEETVAFVDEVEKGVDKKRKEKIFEWSGGIGRLVKFLTFNTGVLDLDLDEATKDSDLQKVLEATAAVVVKTFDGDLERMGLKDGNRWRSSVLEAYLANRKKSHEVKVVLNPDLTFSENGETSQVELTRLERMILARMLANNLMILREEVADLKWGKGSYDEFSDQAIGKTMRRLSAKLVRYSIKTIPQVGYRLESRDGGSR